MSDVHPDFLAAAARAQWTGSLPDLWYALKVEAWQQRGRWAHRILPRGALVAVRVLTQGPNLMRRELRIARRGLGTPEGWAEECRVFLAAFQASGWYVAPSPPAADTQESRWIERYAGEVERGKVPCDGCGVPVAHSVLWGTARCESCARNAGRAEAAAIQQQNAP